jgi:two-component system nitrate/nitrite response regulator NarL
MGGRDVSFLRARPSSRGRRPLFVRCASVAVSKSTPTIIVTPKALLREGIASVLQNTPYKVVATAAGPAELSHVPYSDGQPTLAVIGMNAENENLDEIGNSIRLLRSLMPDCKVALIVEASKPIDPQRVLMLSPDACIFNLGSRDTLIKILELTFMDQRVFVLSDSMLTIASDSAVKTVSNTHEVPNPAGASLTPRERQILISLAEGKSNKAIGRLYNLSDATVKVHLKAILRKTKAHNRTQAAIWAIEHGFRDQFLKRSTGMITDASSLAPGVGQPAMIQSGGFRSQLK